MNTQSINNIFTILIEALTDTDSVHNAHAILQHVSKAQEAFKQQVRDSLPTMTHDEREMAQSPELKTRIQAVKDYRDRVQCGLGEAKSKVDAEYEVRKKGQR